VRKGEEKTEREREIKKKGAAILGINSGLF